MNDVQLNPEIFNLSHRNLIDQRAFFFMLFVILLVVANINIRYSKIYVIKPYIQQIILTNCKSDLVSF